MTDAWGWIAIVAVPLAFWTFLVIFIVMLFGRGETSPQFEMTEELDPAEAGEPIAVPARESALAPSGLGWRPPVASHH